MASASVENEASPSSTQKFLKTNCVTSSPCSSCPFQADLLKPYMVMAGDGLFAKHMHSHSILFDGSVRVIVFKPKEIQKVMVVFSNNKTIEHSFYV